MELSVPTISDFISTTTAHGFGRIHARRSLPLKLLWMLFLAAAMAGFSYHIAQLIINFLSTPISTSISPGAIQFETPDITVCSVSPISSTNYYEMVTKNPSLYTQLYTESRFVAGLAYLKGLGTDYQLIVQIAKDMVGPTMLLQHLGQRREVFIVRCLYKGFNCSYLDFQNYWDSKYGNCFRFMPRDSVLQQTVLIEKFLLELVLFTDNNPVVTNPKSMVIFERLTAGITYEGDYDVSKSGGAILFYGPKNHYPRDFINLSPGVHSYVNFEMVEYRYVSRNAKQCVSANRSVFYEDADQNRIAFSKNKEDCQYRALLDTILKNCGCLCSRIVPPYNNITESINATRCHHITPATNATEFLRRTQCEHDFILRESTLFNSMQQCLPNCREQIYTPIVSMASWPLNSLAVYCKDTILGYHISQLEKANLSVPDTFYYFLRNLTTEEKVQREFASNFAQVTLGANKAFSTVVEEFESYRFFDLFSDIGGILGLYLGMSLLTVCELFELVFVLFSELRSARQGYVERLEWKMRFIKRRDTVLKAVVSKLAPGTASKEQPESQQKQPSGPVESSSISADTESSNTLPGAVGSVWQKKMKMTKPAATSTAKKPGGGRNAW